MADRPGLIGAMDAIGSVAAAEVAAVKVRIGDVVAEIVSAAEQPGRLRIVDRAVAAAADVGAYQAVPGGLPAKYKRTTVSYPTKEAPGTIIIDSTEHYLYYVLDGGKALRYGIGVGREGFGWRGTVRVGRKAEWPGWTPPPAMRKRQPYLPPYMEGGPNNPLGARAMYIGSTLYRIHGSNEPWTIGQAVSSGCIRMANEDVIDLYERVKVGTKVIVS